MAIIQPFKALRPQPQLAKQVASQPYDVLSSTEAKKEAAGNPASFLHVTKSEIDLPESVNIHDALVYAQAKENITAFIKRDVLFRESKECYYMYQLIMHGRAQTGLVCVSSVDDYENGIIKKIGGSGCEGGLIKTITTYRDSSLGGKPSPRTIGVPYLINQSLQKGNKIEIYGILGELVLTDIKGLFGMNSKLASPNYKYMEKFCLEDYHSLVGTYPDWNFQEKNEKWPNEVIQLHLELLNKKSKKELIDENTN